MFVVVKTEPLVVGVVVGVVTVVIPTSSSCIVDDDDAPCIAVVVVAVVLVVVDDVGPNPDTTTTGHSPCSRRGNFFMVLATYLISNSTYENTSRLGGVLLGSIGKV